MSDLNSRVEQEKILSDIFSQYDEKTRKLYMDILKMYSDKGASMPNSKVKEEILDEIKEVVT